MAELMIRRRKKNMQIILEGLNHKKKCSKYKKLLPLDTIRPFEG